MSRFAKNITNFPGNAEAIDADNDDRFTNSTIYVGTGGDVTVLDSVGRSVLFTNVPDGSVIPVLCTAVLATGTVTADDFVRIWE
jgi:hypothetical protein